MVDDTIGNDGGITDKVGAPDGGSGERPADTRVGSHPGVMKLQDLLARSSIAVLSAPANDNATTYSGDALEFETTISGLSAGPLLTWVGADGHAHGHLALSAEFEAGGPSKAHEYAALNAALSDLGPVAPAQDGTRRIQVVEPRPGTFAIMWLALAESALVARGKMYVSEDASDGTGDTSWAKHTIEDVDLPGFMGGFGVASAGVGGDTLEIKYAAAGSSQSISVSTVRPGERAPDDGARGHPAAEAASIAATAGPTVEVTAELEGETPSPRSPPASEPRPTQPLPASPMLEVGASIRIAAEAGTNETEPIVAALGDGFLVAWRAANGSEGLSQIKLALCDEHGAARTLADGNTVLLVSDRVATDAAPAVSSFGEGFAVAYKHGDDGDLVVKAYSAAGFQIGGEIVLHSHANGAIGEIAAAAIQADEQEGSDGDQLAVVYTVEDEVAGADDYGTIMLQRLAIAGEDGEAQSVTLGGDAGPALTVQTRDGCTAPAVGRAPAVVGLDNGELAIVWVENDGSRETIRGGVLELDGAQVLYIDLTDLIGAEGVVKGTEPTLLDAGNGNILVSWLQHDGDYVVMAALYQAVGHGVWVEPEQPMRLKSFDEEPDDYSVALTDAGGPAIVLTWDEAGKEPRNGDGILSQRYDMSGESQGGHVVIADRHALSMKQPASTDSLAAAGLADGQIVVVYAEQSAKGDFDLEAHIVDVPGPEESADKAIGPAKKLETVACASAEPGDAAVDAEFATQIDREIAIDVLSTEARAGVSVARVNGAPIDTATPIDVGSAWVQLREDGWLTVSPDTGYAGEITFQCALAQSLGSETTSSVTVNVEDPGTSAVLPLFNRTTVLVEGLAASPGQDGGASPDARHLDTGVEGLSFAGLDANAFTITDSTLLLNAGVEFDFATVGSGDEDLGQPGRHGAVRSTPDEDVANCDTLVFLPGSRSEAGSGDELEPTPSGYAAFRQLMASGALAQVGDDVVISLDCDDPLNPDTITLKGVSLSNLMDPDFRFS